MKYRVSIEGRAREVDVTERPDGSVAVSLDGEELPVEVAPTPEGLCLRIGGAVYDVAAGGPEEGMQLAAGAARAIASVESERARARKQRGGALASSDDELRAPMPGRVVRVSVAAGDAVEVGAPLLVIEAMKMENELRAEAAGVVRAVHTEVGASVEGRALLISFDLDRDQVSP